MDTVTKATLRVAYLLAASDGAIKPEEREVFKTTLEQAGMKMGDSETTEFLNPIVSTVRKLSEMRDIYDEAEIDRAFQNEMDSDLKEICVYGTPKRLRRAFATWMCVCFADSEYSASERKHIDWLRDVSSGFSMKPGVITDVYLAELEARYREIDELRAKLGTVSTRYEERVIKDSLVTLTECLVSFIDGVDSED